MASQSFEKIENKKLNLGCGFKSKKGFINIDSSEGAHADLYLDLTEKKWPFQDSEISEIHFDYSLEEMGETKKDLFFILQEIYRVCKNEAIIKISFVHPHHDQFTMNPLAVHRLSPQFFQLLSIQNNLNLIANNRNDTCLAMKLNVNFELTFLKFLLSPEIYKMIESQQMTEDQARQRMNFERNICQGVEIELKVVKN